MQAKALIIEPALKGLSGHSYNGVKSLERLAQQCGLQSTILISRRASLDLLAGSDVARIFQRSLYHRQHNPSARGYRKLKARLYRNLAAYLKNAPTDYDCVVLRTASQELVAALADVIHAGLLPSNIRILMWLLFEPAWNAADPAAYRIQHETEYRQAFRSLKNVLDHPGQLHVFSETSGIDETYGKLLNIDVSVCKPPDITSLQTSPDRHGNSQPARVVMLGSAAMDKGYELLAEAIHILRERNIAADFQVHAAIEGRKSRTEPAYVQDIARLLPEPSFTTKNLTEEEYLERLENADLVLLPYRLPAYATRGSGIYLEASRLGIPMIVPDGAQFASEALAQKRAAAFCEHTSLALADAIELAIHDLPRMRACALKAARTASDAENNADLIDILHRVSASGPCLKRIRSWRQLARGAFHSIAGYFV